MPAAGDAECSIDELLTYASADKYPAEPLATQALDALKLSYTVDN
jgi:hypothetical protein